MSHMGHEANIVVTRVQAGTVERMAADGVTRCLALRLTGQINGAGGSTVSHQFVVHPDDLREFLNVINDEAHREFGLS